MKWAQSLLLNEYLSNCSNEWKDRDLFYVLLPQSSHRCSAFQTFDPFNAALVLSSLPSAPLPSLSWPLRYPARAYKEAGFYLGDNRAEQKLFWTELGHYQKKKRLEVLKWFPESKSKIYSIMFRVVFFFKWKIQHHCILWKKIGGFWESCPPSPDICDTSSRLTRHLITWGGGGGWLFCAQMALITS